MLIEDIYSCNVNKKEKEKNMPFGIKEHQVKLIKQAIVRKIYDLYIDLEDNEVYKSNIPPTASIGEIYIDNIKPITELFTIEDYNIPKKKILKRYNEYKKEKE